MLRLVRGEEPRRDFACTSQHTYVFSHASKKGELHVEYVALYYNAFTKRRITSLLESLIASRYWRDMYTAWRLFGISHM